MPPLTLAIGGRNRYNPQHFKSFSENHLQNNFLLLFPRKDKPILIHLPALLFLSLFTGIAASAIAFTAWPLVVPVLFVLFGVDIYLTIFISLLIDCGNALVMTVVAARNGRLMIRKGLGLAGFALPWIFAGILIGRTFIPQNEN